MDKEFPEGIMYKAKREGSPEFVLGSVSIRRAELLAWLDSKNDDWINLDILMSKKVKPYMAVNDWKPEAKPQEQPTPLVQQNNAMEDLEIPF